MYSPLILIAPRVLPKRRNGNRARTPGGFRSRKRLAAQRTILGTIATLTRMIAAPATTA